MIVVSCSSILIFGYVYGCCESGMFNFMINVGDGLMFVVIMLNVCFFSIFSKVICFGVGFFCVSCFGVI